MTNKIISGILVALGYLGLLEGIEMEIWDVSVEGLSGLSVLSGGIAALVSGIVWYFIAKSVEKLE